MVPAPHPIQIVHLVIKPGPEGSRKQRTIGSGHGVIWSPLLPLPSSKVRGRRDGVTEFPQNPPCHQWPIRSLRLQPPAGSALVGHARCAYERAHLRTGAVPATDPHHDRQRPYRWDEYLKPRCSNTGPGGIRSTCPGVDSRQSIRVRVERAENACGQRICPLPRGTDFDQLSIGNLGLAAVDDTPLDRGLHDQLSTAVGPPGSYRRDRIAAAARDVRSRSARLPLQPNQSPDRYRRACTAPTRPSKPRGAHHSPTSFEIHVRTCARK